MDKVYIATILDYRLLKDDVQKRPVGIFVSLENFEQSLEKYSEHIHEGSGKYIVLELIETNTYIFSYDDSPIFYKYNTEKDVYEKCDCPEEHKNVVGFWQ